MRAGPWSVLRPAAWAQLAVALFAIGMLVPPLRVPGMVLGALIGLPLLFRWPEVPFMLFVTAGGFKEDPRLATIGLGGALDVTAVMAALSVVAMGWGWISGRLRLRRPPAGLVLPAVVLWTLACASLLWTMAPGYGEAKVLRFVTLTALALAGPWLLIQDWGTLRRMLGTLAGLGLLMMLDVALGLGADPSGFVQAFGSSGYYGLAATTAQAAIVVVFATWWVQQRPVRGVAAGVALLVLLVGALVSGARSPVMVFGMVMTVLTVWRLGPLIAEQVRAGRPRPEELRLLLILLVAALGIGAVVLVYGDLLATFERRLARLFDSGTQVEWERLGGYAAALDAMGSYPLGLGFGGFTRYFYLKDTARGFPHNIVLEVGSELGILGAAALCALVAGGVLAARRRLRVVAGHQLNIGLALIGLCLFQFLDYQFHGDINDARTMFTWVGCLFAFASLQPPGGVRA